MSGFNTIITLDLDDWAVIGKKFKILSSVFREDSSAAELVLEDCDSNDILKLVVDRKAIVYE